ncbi:ABC transporter substrate-binding protein [Aciduricibacillus chroicocephali]|uniref:ABC transporter substrate-binding protein n=1 Tax=Aciduricibacillus chroicocephali TaxID=3054939 RepID=A0ABY9KSN9_9BACI|nr:ABC transporter substrate-binding protein [Bacillaceae bacterium 44XB]
MKKLRITGILLLFLTFTMLAACGPGSDDKKDSDGQKVEKIKLGEVTRSVFYAPEYVALEKGFFKDAGLDVDLQTTWGGDKTMTALLSASVDIALVGSETSIYVHEQKPKDKVINFAQLTRTDGTFLVSKEADPDFTWDKLKGSSFLGQRKGGMPQMVGEFVLKKNDIDPKTDLNLKQNIDFANIPGAFVSGDDQYVQLFEPTASIFEKEGKGHILASFGEASGEVPYTVFMAKESMLKKDAATIQKFTDAIYKAQQWVDANDAKTIAKVIAPYFEDTDVDMLAASINRYKEQGSYALDPLLKKDAWNNLKDIMDAAGELPGKAPYEELVNTDFAKKAMKK